METRECLALLVLVILTNMHSQLKVLAYQVPFYEVDGTEELGPIFVDDAPDGFCEQPEDPLHTRMSCGKLKSNTTLYVCIGRCKEGFEFPNKKKSGKIICHLKTGKWITTSKFPDCQKEIVCNPPCQNGGSCVDEDSCKCLEGFTGKLCNQRVCTPPCQNGGTCLDKDTCSCAPRFKGNRCEIDICQMPPKPRHGKMKCAKLITEPTKYVCTAECEAGYHFPEGQKRIKHTCDLTTKDWTPGYEFPNCEAKTPAEECKDGWTEYFNTDHPTDPRPYSDIGDDESLDRIREKHPVCTGGVIKDIQCSTKVNGRFVDYKDVGEFGLKCSKNVGFTCNEKLRGAKCEDFAVRFLCDCAHVSCNPPCQNGGSCVNGNKCLCSPGFDGDKCENVACNPPCQNGGSCKNGNKCLCPPGFVGDECQNVIDERPPTDLPAHMCPEVPAHILDQCPPSCLPGFACFQYACVPKENCPCFRRNDTHLTQLPKGSTWFNEKCEECICRTGGNSRCVPKECLGCSQGEISFKDSMCRCRCISCPENAVLCEKTGDCVEKELLCNGAVQCPGIKFTCPTGSPPTEDRTPSYGPSNCSTDQHSETDTCEILGSMLKTFDGHSYRYDTCNHVLMKEQVFESFSVTVRKTCSPERPVKCYRQLVIEVDGLVITLGPGIDTVTVKNTKIPARSLSLVSKKFRDIELKMSGNTLVFRSLKYNFDVTWDKLENSKIKVSECLVNSTVGLCGLYDKSLEGDLSMPNGLVAHNEKEFGDSWAIGSLQHCSPPDYTPDLTNNATAACVKLREKPFQSCYGSAELSRKVEACVSFMLECMQRSISAGNQSLDESEYEKCKCHAYETFTEDCEIYKTRPSQEWRILHDCVPSCPDGMEWQDCGPGCELTCDNYRQQAEICTSDCSPGCYCPSGLVRHHNQCVKPKMCQDCICRGHGDPNYITFDGRYYSFQGTCFYVLAQHVTSQDNTMNFRVVGKNKECVEEPKTSCMEGFKIFWNGHTIEKFKFQNVYLDQREIKAGEYPYDKGGISITCLQNKTTMIHIKKINLVVRFFDEMHGFTIELPSFHYFNKTEGLCGVCNFIQSDDLYHRGGYITNVIEDFAYSWLVKGQKKRNCILGGGVVHEPPLGICNFTANPCETILDPSPFVKSCENDVRYSQTPQASVCRSKFQYAQQCCERGVPLDEWLKLGGCVGSCPNGTVYKCASACPKTCDNYKTYREDDCSVMPQNACVCPEGEVMKLGKCVKTTACEACDEKGHGVGEVWKEGPCKTCECLPNLSTKCTVDKCPEPPVCGALEKLEKLKGSNATCCDSYKCVPKRGGKDCEKPKLEACPPGRSLVVKEYNNCQVYLCECFPHLCPPSVTPFLDDGERSALVINDCCPEVQVTCHLNTCSPPPNCSQGFKLSTERGRCCPKHKCVPQDHVCVYQHQYDVQSGTQIKLPLEKYYDREYQPGSTWHDGLCRECTCVDVKGRLLSACKQEQCQNPANFPDSEKYIWTEVRVAGSCCPQYRRTLCVDRGVTYKIGDKWPSSERGVVENGYDGHFCTKISRCVRDRKGEAVIEVTSE